MTSPFQKDVTVMRSRLERLVDQCGYCEPDRDSAPHNHRLRIKSRVCRMVTVLGGDEKPTTALLDRLAHHATVITTKGKSHRMRKPARSRALLCPWQRRTREEQSPPRCLTRP